MSEDWRVWRDRAPPTPPADLEKGSGRPWKCPPGSPDASEGHRCSVCGAPILTARPWCIDCSPYAKQLQENLGYVVEEPKREPEPKRRCLYCPAVLKESRRLICGAPPCVSALKKANKKRQQS